MLTKLIGLMGKPIQSEEMRAFFEENEIKYPKKDTISTRGYDRDFWVESKKTGMNFLFSIEVLNDKYPIDRGEYKGVFIPILKHISFQGKANVDYPSQVSYKSSLEDLNAKFGEPIIINKSFLGTVHIWKLIQDTTQDIIFQINYNVDKESISVMSLVLYEKTELIMLYDVLSGDTIENLAKNAMNSFYIKEELFFINWALQNDYLSFDKLLNDSLRKFKSGEITIVEFVTENFANKSYIAKEDFVNVDAGFVSDYYKNLSGHDIVFQRDFGLAFLKDEKQRSNYLGKDAFAELAKVEYSPENLQLISNLIDHRLAEYKEHKFSKSESEIRI